MPICSALTRAGHPCRGHGTPVEGCTTAYLCHMHRDYFTDHKADKHVTDLVYAFMTDTERGWIFRMLKSALYKADPKWLVEHFKALAASPYQSMAQRATYLYDLYVLGGVLSPLASLQFWRRCVAYNLRVIGYCSVYDIETRTVTLFNDFDRMVGTFLRHYVAGLPCHVVLPYLLAFMANPFDVNPIAGIPAQVAKDASAEMWRVILKTLIPAMHTRILMAYPLETVFKAIDAKHADAPASIWWSPTIRDYLASLLKTAQRAERAAARRRFDPLREELMMAAWHPTRVERWLDAGLEIDAM